MSDREKAEEAGAVIAIRCPAELRASVEQLAEAEGLSNSAFARRALLLDVRARKQRASA